ncbi:hypothetical protein DFS34DRAFT_667758 [Phlyctochytrium arcticum]|nr:hypothetical protein DFS34DRAFT_667758 [Phlyctochytrium arcticum]
MYLTDMCFLYITGAFSCTQKKYIRRFDYPFYSKPARNSIPSIRHTRMPAGSQLPIEIIDRIVELAPSDRRIRKTLTALCLVSRALRDVAQPHLWAVAANAVPEAKKSAFYIALATNPQLGKFVKTLRIISHGPAGLNLFQAVANYCPNL